jgi:hypothetical protein
MNYGTHHHWYISGFAVLALFVGWAAYHILTSRAAMDTFDVIFICVAVAVAIAVVLGVIHFALHIHHKHEGHRIEMRAKLAVVEILENEAKAATSSERSALPDTADHLAILYGVATSRPAIQEQRHNVLSRYPWRKRSYDVVEKEKQIPPRPLA